MFLTATLCFEFWCSTASEHVRAYVCTRCGITCYYTELDRKCACMCVLCMRAYNVWRYMGYNVIYNVLRQMRYIVLRYMYYNVIYITCDDTRGITCYDSESDIVTSLVCRPSRVPTGVVYIHYETILYFYIFIMWSFYSRHEETVLYYYIFEVIIVFY